MGRRVRVSTAELYAEGMRISAQAVDYRRLANRIFAEVSAMGDHWRGADNLAYVMKIEGFRDDLMAMASEMDAYGVLLKSAAVKYSQAQSRALQAATKV